ncbi:MAG: hypothetical protein IKP73_09135 [Bacteroidales bacterium]|nr:hypothetical protein [Bacteroidales bacterium]
MEKIMVPIDDEIANFEQFLDDESNHRILFTGMFGSGKTYFLQNFFEQKKEKYELFYISPVNYCISRNEDILKLLQYDLLVDIMFKNLLPDTKEQFSHWATANYFVYYNLLNLVKDAVSHCGDAGKKASDVCGTYLKWISKYNQFHDAANKTDVDEIAELVETMAGRYEFDQNIELINGIISGIDKKTTVLIIDDLDRIDPEHIFRILNVFSAQLSGYFASHSFGVNETENKFGFKKVIFVCDIDNIRNIFHSKYGQNTDFSGYIDKFYSTEPYVWDNNKQVLNAVYQYVNSVRMELDKDTQRSTLYLITKILVHYKLINLRKLVEKERQIWNWPYRKHPTNFVNTIEIVDFVLFLFGTEADAVSVLSKRYDEIDLKEKSDVRLFDHLMPLLDDNFSKYKQEENIARKYANQNFDIVIEYYIYFQSPARFTSISKITDYNSTEKTKVPFFQLLSIAIEKYCKWIKENEIIRY